MSEDQGNIYENAVMLEVQDIGLDYVRAKNFYALTILEGINKGEITFNEALENLRLTCDMLGVQHQEVLMKREAAIQEGEHELKFSQGLRRVK